MKAVSTITVVTACFILDNFLTSNIIDNVESDNSWIIIRVFQ